MLTLVYFEITGRGEFDRLVLEAGKVNYVKQALQYPPTEEWAALKPSTPLGKLPVLRVEDSGLIIGESIAVARYAAKKAGLYPNKEEEAALSDMFVDRINNEKVSFIQVAESKDKDALDKHLNEALPAFLSVMEEKINDHGYLVGESLTWADICLYDATILTQHDVADDIHPKVHKLVEKVKSNEGIRDYLNSNRRSATWGFRNL